MYKKQSPIPKVLNEFNGIFTSNSEYLSLINLATVRKIGVLDQLDRNEHLGKIERDKLQVVAKHIEDYKNTYQLIDYNDMLDKFINQILSLRLRT